MRIYLEDRHKEYIRKLGHEPGAHIDAEQHEYFEARRLWAHTLTMAHGKIDEDLLHEKAIGHLVSQQQRPKVVIDKRQKRESRILLIVLLVIGILVTAKTAHCQFSHINTIQTKNGGSAVGFHASPFVINCSTNTTCSDDGTTFTITASSSAGTAWSSLTAPAGNLALTMAHFSTTWTFDATTGASANMLVITDTLNNTGTGIMLDVDLASGSAMKPARFAVNGNGVQVSNAGVLAALGTGHVNADQCSGATCGTVSSVATTSPITGGTITGTGTIACGTCATTTNGGALSGTSPVTVSAAGAIGCATCLTANQSITLSGDVTGSGSTAITTTNVNLPDGVTQAGSLLLTDIAAPTSPAAAHLKVFGDSTDLRFHDKNAAGTIGTTVVADTGASSNYISAISAAGVITKSRPTCATLSDSAGGCTMSTTGAGDISGTLPSVTVTNGSHITNSSIPNSGLVNTGTTVSGATCTLGSSCTITRICADGLGDGLNAITAGTYIVTNCFNDFGATYTITGIRCFTDNSGSSTLNAANDGGTGLLTGAVTCSSAFAAGTQSATTTIATSHWINFTFVADGTTKRATFEVTVTR